MMVSQASHPGGHTPIRKTEFYGGIYNENEFYLYKVYGAERVFSFENISKRDKEVFSWNIERE